MDSSGKGGGEVRTWWESGVRGDTGKGRGGEVVPSIVRKEGDEKD